MMFTQDEANFIAAAVNEEVKRTGLQSSSMGLIIVAKLQEDLKQQQAENKVDKEVDEKE